MSRTLTVTGLVTALSMATGPAWAATSVIVQAGQTFSETKMNLNVGDHIVFSNQDEVNHNILVQTEDDDDDGLDKGVQAPGRLIDVAFDKAGKFKVRCHIHPGMRLAVTVR